MSEPNRLKTIVSSSSPPIVFEKERSNLHILKHIKLTARDVFKDANEYLFNAYDLFEFVTAWATLLFLSLVFAPLIALLWVLATPVYVFSLLFRKKEPTKPPEVVSYPLKKRPEKD